MSATRIRRLAFSSYMQDLVEGSGDFDLMQVLGVSSRELAYSNVFAFFLDPNQAHGGGSKPLVFFLRHLDSAADNDILPFSSLLGNELGRVRVTREYSGIDILIELTDQRAVIAVENKIYAAEQFDQVARYQSILTREYGNWARSVVFLSPFNVQPQTSDPDSDVPVVLIAYDCVAYILEQCFSGRFTNSANFANAVVSNIRQTLLEQHPMKDKIYALWADPEFSQALSEVVYHAPKFSTVKDEFSERTKAWAGSQRGLTVSAEEFYPPKQEPYELALRFEQWDNLGLPITIKFYWRQNTAYWNNQDNQPGIRAFIWWEHFKAKKDNFYALRDQFPESISPDFSPVKGWTNWRRFFSENNYPQDSLIPFRTEGFVDELVTRACRVIDDVDRILRNTKES